MVRWMRWHCSPDTRLEIRTLAELATSQSWKYPTLLNTVESLRVSREETLLLWNLNAKSGSNPRFPTFQACRCNHCTMTPALIVNAVSGETGKIMWPKVTYQMQVGIVTISNAMVKLCIIHSINWLNLILQNVWLKKTKVNVPFIVWYHSLISYVFDSSSTVLAHGHGTCLSIRHLRAPGRIN